MPLLNKELFVDAMLNRQYHPYMISYEVRNADAQFRVKPDRESALKVLDTIGESILAGHQMHKGMRPWDVHPDVFKHLDPKQAWWGFEFETGWRGQEQRRQALEHVWNNFDGCMFDGEGEGDWAVEITFTPDNASSYADDTAAATRFVQWMDANQPLIYAGNANDVGCHWNVSTPHFRNGDRTAADLLARFLNRTIRNTMAVNGQRKRLFGRESLYAGFLPNSSGDHNQNVWLECKGFRTAYTLEKWNDYLKTCAALQKFIDYFFANLVEAMNSSGTNLYDVAFNGAEVQVAKEQLPPAHNAARLFSRPYGGADAGCHF